MEITDFGPVVLVDTAGFADRSDLSEKRIEKSLAEIDKIDIFLYCLSEDDDLKILEKINKPVIFLAMHMDKERGKEILEEFKDKAPIPVDIRNTKARDEIFARIRKIYKKKTYLSPKTW